MGVSRGYQKRHFKEALGSLEGVQGNLRVISESSQRISGGFQKPQGVYGFGSIKKSSSGCFLLSIAYNISVYTVQVTSGSVSSYNYKRSVTFEDFFQGKLNFTEFLVFMWTFRVKCLKKKTDEIATEISRKISTIFEKKLKGCGKLDSFPSLCALV